MTSARINGISLHYEVSGSGPAVLLTHGYSSTGRAWAGRAWEVGLRVGGLAFAILIVIAIFAIVSKPNTFLTVSNSMVILRGMSTIAIVALGLLLVVIVGEIDLSFGFTYGLAASLISAGFVPASFARLSLSAATSASRVCSVRTSAASVR